MTVRLSCPLAGGSIAIRALGDFQYTGRKGTTAMDHLKRDIEATLKEGGFFLGMGDMLDTFSPSNRQRLKAAALYDTAEDVIDQKALELVHELFDEALKPTVGRWLGLLEGHHFAELRTGDTSDMRLCELLKARFLGTEAVIRLLLSSGTAKFPIEIYAHHGVGAGVTAGAPLNRLERIAASFENISVFLMGHTVKMPAAPDDKMRVRWNGHSGPDLIHREVRYVNTGSYSKSRIVGSKQGRIPRGGYAEKGMMKPAIIGSPVIRITSHFRYADHRDAKRRTGSGRVERTWEPTIKVEI